MLKAFLLKWIGDISYSQLFDLIGKLAWPLTLIFLLLIFRKDISALIKRTDTIKKGDMTVAFASTKDLDEVSKMALSPTIDRLKTQSLAKLADLLSQYQYTWSAWTISNEFSQEVRFADRYSGPEAHVKFINDYVKDLDDFDKHYGRDCPIMVKEPLSKLTNYLKEVLRYQIEGQKLSAPAFSIPKYSDLYTTVVNATVMSYKDNI